MLNDVYGSAAPPKSRTSTHEDILSEDEIRQRMSDITRRFPIERTSLRDAYKALAKRDARTLLAITFRQPDLLGRAEAKDYLQKAVEGNMKLTESDKAALKDLELESEKIAYDLAKFDCETSDKDYSKLEKQLSFYQSLLKLGD